MNALPFECTLITKASSFFFSVKKFLKFTVSASEKGLLPAKLYAHGSSPLSLFLLTLSSAQESP
jgi:hypothetical protein